MARGNFFKGFRPQLSSSARAFARRGDPWMTDREGKRDYDRLVEVENPDMDADRQRNERIRGFSKEFQDRAKPTVKVEMTMREAIETERSTRLDGYQAEKAKPFKPKPLAGQWPQKGVDFEVATVRRRAVGVAVRLKRELRELGPQEVKDTSSPTIGCPYGCGLTNKDSRAISRHLRRYKNSCCTHASGCNCPDCRSARNDP